MKIHLHKGYHSAELARLVTENWQAGDLLIVAPPQIAAENFLPLIQAAKFAEAPIFGVFTSGTLSGSPRLVLYSRRNLEAALDAIFALFDWRRIEHVFCYPQAFHTFGLTLGYLSAARLGFKLHAPEGKYSRAAHLQRLELRHERVLTLGTPTHFFDLLTFTRERGERLTPSYTCIAGGAAVSRQLWNCLQSELGIEAPSIGYGCTEAAPGIAHLPPGLAPMSDNEIGYPLPSLRAEPRPSIGVALSGPALCLAVVHDGRVEFAEEMLIRDRIEVGPDGRWHFLGRYDLQLNRGGAKHSLEAIEGRIHAALGVTVAAVAVRDARLGEDLAVLIAQGAESLSTIVLKVRNLLQQEFGIELHPRRIRGTRVLPLNRNGKLDRNTICTLFADESTIAP